MKKLAARNFEDILQCSMPCFQSLFKKEHNKVVMDLLFDLAHWHALAKLRMHDDSTVLSLEDATRSLGGNLRKFTSSSAGYDTKELPKERDRRTRREGQSAAQSGVNEQSTGKRKRPAGSRSRVFNMSTAKMHFLGDYAYSIKEYGTTDNYTMTNVR
ncbi:hypothetical protein MPER_01259 [Moniliophthora perniciosa FA553]|nr:hypothetical protein MPER_01259 [Moniliophthora perniciosa FA553]